MGLVRRLSAGAPREGLFASAFRVVVVLRPTPRSGNDGGVALAGDDVCCTPTSHGAIVRWLGLAAGKCLEWS